MDPGDRAKFEAGRRAGMISAGVAATTGTLGGLLTAPAANPIVDAAGNELGGSLQAIRNALPSAATMEQAAKVAKIVYHLGLGTGGATFLWHEIFGSK